ncbi:flavin-containing monooxygenase FMO GS-OX-like 4 [Hibiscus syriacus]|nr:flavin-containing monooxygenase FMO GS-OX-like 4 [Hibiscus syriacus]
MGTLTINLAMPHSTQSVKSHHVAVVGAGAAGLVAARELFREGHSVVVFERGNEIGGTWVYTPHVEPDPLGLDPKRPIVHSSLYSSLRTNLPREVMGYVDFPFVTRPGKSRDPRRYPGHREVLMYLKDFAREFGVEEMVRFETEVVKVRILENGKWNVQSKKTSCFINENEKKNNYNDDVDIISKSTVEFDEIYDAVVVCNGHYTQPCVAEIPGINSWPGKQMHSHNYRTPEPFRDQVVILIGSSSSAVDICRDLAAVAKEVHVASRSVADETYTKQPGYDNLWFHSMIDNACDDGGVVFRNGKVVLAGVIMHCTGYKYNFPFLDTKGIVTVDDNRLGPLYKHVFPPVLAPYLSFIGIPWKIVPFPLSELQSKLVAGVLSGRITLPSQKEMTEDVNSFYSTLEASGIPKRYTHCIGESQFEYNNWLAAQCGCQGVEKWRKPMYTAASANLRLRPETYRDEWEDHDLVLEAYEDFVKHTSTSNL